MKKLIPLFIVLSLPLALLLVPVPTTPDGAGVALAATGGAGDGKAIFLAQKCNLCHSVSSAGIEATTKSEKVKGPDIKGLADRHDRGWVEKWLRQEIEVNGKKHSKAFKGSDEDFATLVDWLMAQ